MIRRRNSGATSRSSFVLMYSNKVASTPRFAIFSAAFSTLSSSISATAPVRGAWATGTRATYGDDSDAAAGSGAFTASFISGRGATAASTVGLLVGTVSPRSLACRASSCIWRFSTTTFPSSSPFFDWTSCCSSFSILDRVSSASSRSASNLAFSAMSLRSSALGPFLFAFGGRSSEGPTFAGTVAFVLVEALSVDIAVSVSVSVIVATAIAATGTDGGSSSSCRGSSPANVDSSAIVDASAVLDRFKRPKKGIFERFFSPSPESSLSLMLVLLEFLLPSPSLFLPNK
mmetsp:Transcript_9466/g.23236  ORF Transcript_9466/g.23236 Transcript_9466/m.23236 type:complete len:288 (-) Transcript_9466:483-1346(-)